MWKTKLINIRREEHKTRLSMKLQRGDESEPGGAAEALPAELHRGRSSSRWSSGPDGDTAAMMDESSWANLSKRLWLRLPHTCLCWTTQPSVR